MLNTTFPKRILNQYSGRINDYVLPKELGEFVSGQNIALETTREVRLQEVFTREIWKKLNFLGLENFDWQKAKILDVACGGGFLSYHLLKRVAPMEITLNDISPSAILEAKKLLSQTAKTKINFYQGDVLTSDLPPESFDIIIGNSFMHHFYDVPKAVREFSRLLKPGGIFITLHEPTPAAVAYESGNILLVALYALRGKKYIEDIRKMKGSFEMRNPGGDVWLFEPNKLKAVFEKQNFEKVETRNWHMFRSFFAGCFSLHLSQQRPKFGRMANSILNLGISLDAFLNKFLPAACFGSISIAAIKKHG